MKHETIVKILILLLILSGTGALAYFQYEKPAHSPTNISNDAVERLVACTGENFIECARPLVNELLVSNSGADVMNLLSEKYPSSQCHFFGHVVGQQLYLKTGNVEHSLSTCNNACASACVHGVIGEAFAQEAGIDEDAFDPQHLRPEDVRLLGERLCASNSTCHGVGHALFMTYGEFDPALALCAEIATGAARVFCYRGVFMQYADIISEKSTRDSAIIARPTFETLASLCTHGSIEGRLACFRYLPRMHADMQKEFGATVEIRRSSTEQLCESLSDKESRNACFLGLGVYYAGSFYSDPQFVHDMCEHLSLETDQASCTLGAISSAAEYRRTSELIAYCDATPDTLVRKICYHAVFSTTHFMGVSIAGNVEYEMACAKSPNPECAEGIAEYKNDPWERILAQ